MQRITFGKSLLLGAVVLGVVSIGCKSEDGKWSWGSPQAKESKAAVASMKETHDYLGKAALELEGTRAALDRVATTTDLKGWMKEYSGKVADMESAGAKARDRWYDMKQNSQAYIDKWDQEISETSTPEVKEAMEVRRARIKDRLEGVIASAQQLRDSYQPYLKSLKELEAGLKLDLTPAGVAAFKPAIEKAKSEGDVVAKELNELGIEIDKLAGRLTPPATQPKQGA